jgi:hypothetical protein
MATTNLDDDDDIMPACAAREEAVTSEGGKQYNKAHV